ncbi:MAG: MTH1187 family thiamine-binding protein [Candidatus Thiodiazotropha sp.]
MSILLEFSMFPLDQGESLSEHVSGLVKLIRERGIDFRLTAMGTIVETERLDSALALVEECNALLRHQGCKRVFASIKLDIREGPMGRLTRKIHAVEQRIGALE